jgi:hypothetical protein
MFRKSTFGPTESIRVIKEDKIGGTYSLHGEDEKQKIIFGKYEVARSFGKPKCRLEDNIKWILEK